VNRQRSKAMRLMVWIVLSALADCEMVTLIDD